MSDRWEEMRAELSELTVKELKAIAKADGITLGYDASRKDTAVGAIVSARRHYELNDVWNTRAERTCHIVESSRKYVLSDGTELFEDGCSECNGYLGDGDNYCPNCGAKVER